MKASIYLSNGTIYAVAGDPGRGKASVQSMCSMDIPEGVLINGVITNEEELRDLLARFWKENKLPVKDVSLVVNSSNLATKKLSMPDLGVRRTLQNVVLEFADGARQAADTVYDYRKLRAKGKLQELFAVAADRSFVDGFVQLFRSIHVTLSSVDSGLNAALKVLEALPEMRDSTGLIQIMDGYSLQTILLAEGEYVYSAEKRIFSTPGTESFAMDVVRNISSTVQFYLAQNKENRLEQVWICGVSEEDYSQIREQVRTYGMEQRVERLSVAGALKGRAGAEASDFIYPLGGMLTGGKELNLLKAYQDDPEARKKRGRLMKLVLPPAVILGAGILASAALFAVNVIKSAQNREIEDYVNNPLNVARVLEADQLEIDLAYRQNVLNGLSSARKMIDSYPLMDSWVESRIQACAAGIAQVEVQSYEASTGTLRMKASTASVEEINTFVYALEETGLFARVDYKGYTFSEKEATYSLNISCQLNSSAGRQEE
ncbi:type IV pilus biogenesis protein PilM [Cuneatibacter caecimuris]|uniref:Tfp pilus assembly PilM family ATPase n=1 Tax=Cuneatibacter caecimuris TaxID=1796618 RepID=A0A4Q7PMV4_9FIRM|nr:pilus assembly protein PilM [Cuneatibacter caecimuris]RZT02291.1 Tfp pilus assembly PilM family ATPase [Cuneatibacter caecimuris]